VSEVHFVFLEIWFWIADCFYSEDFFALGNLGQSLARLKISGRSTPQWPKCNLQKNVHVGCSIWANRTLEIWDSQKCPNLRLLTTFDFDREYLWKGSTHRISEKLDQPQSLPRWAKNGVNFGPETKKFYWLILTNPHGHFSGDYISAIGGCCALKFLNVLEIDQGYLLHTPTGTGSPPQKK